MSSSNPIKPRDVEQAIKEAPVYAREEPLYTWGAVITALIGIGGLAAAGYFGGLAWHQGTHLLDSVPFALTVLTGTLSIAVAILLNIVAHDISQSREKAETLATDDNVDTLLSQQNDEAYSKIIRNLSHEHYGRLLERAPQDRNLASRLVRNRSKLMAHLGTASPDAVRACIDHVRAQFMLVQFQHELGRSDLATRTPEDQKEKLVQNLRIIEGVFKHNSIGKSADFDELMESLSKKS